jgi:hypothetical protein
MRVDGPACPRQKRPDEDISHLCDGGPRRDRWLLFGLGLSSPGGLGLVARARHRFPPAFRFSPRRIESGAAGRAFAAYGGVYIAASHGWLWEVESVRSDRWDLVGGTVCLAGASIILLGPRAA